MTKRVVKTTQSGPLRLDEEAEAPPPSLQPLLFDRDGSSLVYRTLRTLGDGACGLHACFGCPVGGAFRCVPDPRQAAAMVLSESFAAMEGVPANLSFVKIRDALWMEFCVPCGEKMLLAAGSGEGRKQTVEPEAEMFWRALSDEAQSAICRHIAMQRAERRREAVARTDLAEVARRCCDVALEPMLFRPYAVFAGLLPDVTMNYLAMTRAECLECIAGSPGRSELMEEAFRMRTDGLKIVRGTMNTPFPGELEHPPAHKYAALFDGRVLRCYQASVLAQHESRHAATKPRNA